MSPSPDGSSLARRVARRLRRRLPRRPLGAGVATSGEAFEERLRGMRTLFSPRWYLANGGRLSSTPGPMPALRDYVERGHLLQLPPHPLFDPIWYRQQAGRLPARMTPLEHYLSVGASAGLSPHPLFDAASPAAKAAPAGVNPAVHYLRSPQTWHLAPNDLFSGRYYLRRNKEVARRGAHPLIHYIRRGDLENFRPHRLFDPASYRKLADVPRGTNALAHYLANRDHRFTESVADIAFAEHATPRVSIVVPVYGKWDYTRECLRALSALRTATTFEVVVVDDASPDDSGVRLASIPGLRVVTHTTNTGYVGACNSGIEAARGELVVLLNNDTRVAADWLDPLVDRMADPTIGLVGSKLIYPSGLLQEAGGIIYSDGSGRNYGKFEGALDPQYNYTRDVDYCSGASIMLRATDLRRIGGLSEELAPAYYDDTDLAFAVRAQGLRVVYEPRSVVVHDEGISHGTDESQGIKAYQVVNREKFVEKWRDALVRHYPNDPSVVAKAARRLQGKDIVVVVDHFVPRPDDDSGSVRMMAMLRELRAQGHAVIFVPHNRGKSAEYGEALQAMGVEVLHDHRKLSTFLAPLRGQVAAVILSRYRTALAHIEDIRWALPDTPVIFDTVDLHFLRGERESELLVDGPPPAFVKTVRELELTMIRTCDTTLVVSPVEQTLLGEIVPGADVRVISNVHPRLHHIAAVPTGRAGLLFVGSFTHTPNTDAVKWFVTDVLPILHRTHPGLPVRVVGRDPDPELVEAAPAGVEYLGWVEDLEPVYAQARVSIAPLRYGAGVKGKIGEAISHGLPVVTTPVGAEGMGLESGVNSLVGNDADEFARHVLALLGDDELWSALSKEGQEHIDRTLGEQRFAADLAALIPSLEVDAERVGAPGETT